MARILIIEDTKNIRTMVRLALEKEGHEIALAEDGEQGLELFAQGEDWDLTLVDQRMPKIEGREVVIEARRRDPMARLIMMTAFASSELAAEVMAAGAVDFLRKPFATEVLRNAVEVALAQPRHETTPMAESTSETETPTLYIPRVSWRVNGFSLWPLENVAPPTAEFGRVFQVRQPDGETSRCFVTITPHIRAETQRQSGQELADDDEIWERLCGEAVLAFIWEHSRTPPAVLPVFEVHKSTRPTRTPISWGPFGKR